MSSITLAFGSKSRFQNRRRVALSGRPVQAESPHLHDSETRSKGTALSALRAGSRGVIVDVRCSEAGRFNRLLGLGVTPGARITVLQTFPGIVFLCDQTELAVERRVADSIVVRTEEIRR